MSAALSWRIIWCYGPRERGNSAIFTAFIDGEHSKESAVARLGRAKIFKNSRRGPFVLEAREATPDDRERRCREWPSGHWKSIG